MKVIHRVEDTTKILELSIADDKTKLFARVTPQLGCGMAHIDTFIKDISAVAPAELIDEMVVKDIVKELKEGKGCDERRVAKGIAPTQGRDGKVVWLVRRFTPGKKEDEGRELSDFFSLGLFENVTAGRELARVYKPAAGVPGKDVTGTEIPWKPGKPAQIKFEKSVSIKPSEKPDEYDLLVAEIDGYVHDEGGKVMIRDVLQITGNLDYSTGHIDFIGGVKIAGDVQKGFHIKARKDIEVAGSVLGGNVLTSEGAITVKGFHNGGENAAVHAKGVFTVAVAQGINAEARGNVVIQKEARDCLLRTCAQVLASKAVVVGGVTQCVKGFEAKEIGNEGGAKTVVELRSELEVTDDFRTLQENIKKHEAALATLELHLGPFLANRKRLPLLKSDLKIKMGKLLEKYDAVKGSLDKLRKQETTLREGEGATVEHNAPMNVVGCLFEGVVLNSTKVSTEFKDRVQGPATFTLNTEETEWVKGEYKALSG